MQHIEKYGIRYLYHLTHIDNLPLILQHGLLSHNEAYIKRLTRVNIANMDVLNLRRHKCETIYKRLIFDYACLYFNPKNPMLYAHKDRQHEVVILAFDKMLLSRDQTIITDGNAAARETKFYANVHDLDKVAWNVLRAHNWTDFYDGKRKRCAEILVYPRVEIEHLQKIFCHPKSDYQKVRSAIPTSYNIQVMQTHKLYFGE